MNQVDLDDAVRRLDEIVARVRAKMPKLTMHVDLTSPAVLYRRPGCAEPGCERPQRKRDLCCTHYNRRYQPNRSHGPTTLAEWKRQNPERAARSKSIKQHRRRARLLGVPAERVDRHVVGKRDGWRCGYCHRKINPALRAPHPLSQSLDHIEPLSEGGHHTYANVRIVHLRCNTVRGNRGGNEQLALLG